ncbi:hypothetical protein [Amycolatopsis alba]|uniref:Uncharacterized protein n=1 Tax=Amycolatopsis alba DSM 44262 TaxID=1125972 RepID=A0A229RK61_AMYAL|nr:hypothetical protein [Amycolatopsis alba]OXM47047.1 hypothetical protein CFP75_25565 [Amycolatopsis alba DSM 44262]
MGTSEAIDVLIRDWPGIRERLTDRTRELVQDQIAELASEPIPELITGKAGRLCLLIGNELPPVHPFRVALTEGGTRFLRSDPDPVALADWFSTREILLYLVARRGTRQATAAEVQERAEAWLLAADSLSENELVTRGADPGAPDLIQLEGHDGRVQWPAFQFGARTDLVKEINGILAAADDPWGAADWWLGRHSRLGGAPAALLGEVDDQVLLDAARTERAEA